MSLRTAAAAAVLVAMVLGIVLGDRGVGRLVALSRDLIRLEAAVGKLADDNRRLAAEAARLRDDPRELEAVARRELGLVAPGEVVFEFAE
jgi:cell division protein FtsB